LRRASEADERELRWLEPRSRAQKGEGLVRNHAAMALALWQCAEREALVAVTIHIEYVDVLRENACSKAFAVPTTTPAVRQPMKKWYLLRLL